MPQLRERIGPDAREATVRDRLEELRGRGVVAGETYPASTTLYYLDPPEAGEPSAPDETPTRSVENPLDRLSAVDFLTLREPDGIRTLVLAGYQLSLVLFAVGFALVVAGLDAPVRSDHELWTAAWNLLLVCVAIRIAELVAHGIRSRRSDP